MSLLLVIYATAWQIQESLFLNWDVSLLLNVTRKMLAGGSYSNDFFTPNPPLIMYVYALPIFVSKILSINIIYAFRGFIFLLASLSFGVCHYLIKKIINKHDVALTFTLCIAGIFLILPLFEFGQREHVFVILTLPYLLITVARIQKISLPLFMRLLIGLLAGIGLAIKPHFLLMLIGNEAYLCWRKKRLRALLSPEIMMIITCCCLHFLIIYIWHVDFLTIVLPFMLKHYYNAVSMSLWQLLQDKIVYLSWFAVFCYFLLPIDKNIKPLSTILFLATLTSFCIFVLQGTSFFYHLIPLFSFSLLLIIIMLTGCLKPSNTILIFSLASLLFYGVYSICNPLWVFAQTYKSELLLPLITFVNQQKISKQPLIYVLSEINYSSPLIEYTKAKASQRFDILWMVEALVKRKQICGEICLKNYLTRNQEQYFFLHLIAEDLQKLKPDFIFVDVREKNTGINGKAEYFAILNYFLLNDKFHQAWQPYRYLTTLTNNVFKLEIYCKSKESI